MIGYELLETLDSLGYSVFKVIISILWQSSILLSAVAVLSWFLRHRGPSIRFILWVSAILLIPVLPLISSGISTLGTPQKEITVIPEYTAPVSFRYNQLEHTEIPAYSTPQAMEIPDESVDTAPLQFSQKSTTAESGKNKVWAIVISAVEIPVTYPWSFVLLGYGAGLLFFLAWIFTGRMRIRNWISTGDAIMDESVLNIFLAAGERLGIKREFIVIESAKVSAPLTCRTWRPVVILPNGFIDEMSEKEILSVVLHELSHVKRNDVAVLSMLSFVKALLFFHPLVWFAVRQASYIAELSCDALVIEHTREPVLYADMLTRIAENLPKRAMTTELAAGFLFSKSMFFHRVTAIINNNHQAIKRFSKLVLTATVATACLSLAVALALPLGEKAARTGNMVTISGTVLHEGEPVSGAEVYVTSMQNYYNWDMRSEIVYKGKSGRDGSFSCDIPRYILNQRNPLTFLRVYKKGKGVCAATFLGNADYTLELEKVPEIEGTVTDSEGKPIKGAEVYVPYIPELKTKTDRNGHYVLENISHDMGLIVSVIRKGYAKGRLNDIFRGMKNVNFILAEEGRITGQITYEGSGAPAKGIRVYAANIDYQGPTSEIATTDRNGEYILPNLKEGMYHVTIYPEHNSSVWVAEPVENVSVEHGNTTASVNLMLVEGDIVTGIATDGETGKPLSDIMFIAYPDQRNPRFISGIAITGDDGTFKTRIDSKGFKLQYSAPPGYVKEDEGGTVSGNDNDSENVLHHTFRKGLTVSGRVFMPDGTPASNIILESRPYWGGGWYGRIMTNSDGLFTIAGLEDGKKIVVASIDEKNRLYIDTVVELNEGEDVELHLKSYETTALEGRITNEIGEGIPGAVILKNKRFYDPNRQTRGGPFGLMKTAETVTDENGFFRTGELRLGEEDVSFSVKALGYDSVDIKEFDILKPDMNSVDSIELPFAETHELRIVGKVIDPDGNPIVGARIIYQTRQNEIFQAHTGKNGGFMIEGVPDAILSEMAITHDDYGWYKFLYVQTNTMRTYTLLPLSGKISGTVTDPDGNPVVGASISHGDVNIGPSGIVNYSCRSDEKGRFTIENLVGESYTLTSHNQDENNPASARLENVKVNSDDIHIVLTKGVQYQYPPEMHNRIEYYKATSERRGTLIGNHAPELEVAEWLNNEPVSMSDLKGKVVILYFWDFRSFISVAPLTILDHWQKKYGDDISVIAVHGNVLEKEKILNVISDKSLTLSVGVDKSTDIPGVAGVTHDAYAANNTLRYPNIYLIDRYGVLRFREHGLKGGTQLLVENIEKNIETLLAEKE